MMSSDLNLFYKPLQPCNFSLYCSYFYSEKGFIIVCIEYKDELYSFFKRRGIDLFKSYPYLKDGDKCCICIYKWVDAYHAGIAPKIVGESTSIEVLKHVPMEILKNYLI
jgi:uncharacterized protein